MLITLFSSTGKCKVCTMPICQSSHVVLFSLLCKKNAETVKIPYLGKWLISHLESTFHFFSSREAWIRTWLCWFSLGLFPTKLLIGPWGLRVYYLKETKKRKINLSWTFFHKECQTHSMSYSFKCIVYFGGIVE